MHMHGRMIADKHSDAGVFEAADVLSMSLIMAKQLHHVKQRYY